MRLFQNAGLYPAYLPRLNRLRAPDWSFQRQRDAFLRDGFGAAHILLPVVTGNGDAFFANSDDEVMQRQWARENGLRSSASLETILLAQIEHHRAEFFYNSDPMRYQGPWLRRLPACVRKSIAWRAAPSPGADLSAYDLVVCNFPGILQRYRDAGWKTAYFSPSHHPALDELAVNADRPIDVLFVGGYSRHHARRAELLRAVAALQDRYRVEFHLDRSRLTRVSESAVGRLLPLAKYRRPPSIRRISRPAVFGQELYLALANAKIVVNGAIDMAEEDRGNLRCFEAMGCGALMISDRGRYPKGMEDGVTMVTYRDARDAVAAIEAALSAPGRMRETAAKGLELMQIEYSKARQWLQFNHLVEGL